MKTLYISLILLGSTTYSCASQPKESTKQIIEVVTPKDTLTSVTFNVDNVNKPDSLLKAFTLLEIMTDRIGKDITYIPNSQTDQTSLASYNNGLIQTIHSCFDQHRPLILTPDAIWLTISQGISIHVNQNFDSLQHILFTSAKQVELYVQNDSLEFGSKHWGVLIDSLALKTKQYTKNDFYNLSVGKFSTTTKINTSVYHISLLETYKQKFDYTGGTGCGIPTITLKGTLKDWQDIYKKLDKLNDLGLGRWSESLKPIIQEFINCYQGEVNTPFWKDIYKNASVYGGTFVSGWIINLFPYTKSYEYNEKANEYGESERYEVYSPNEYLGGYNYLRSKITTKNFPDGVSVIDLKWINYFKGDTTDMEIYGGIFGVKQYQDLSLEPIISWAICKKNAPKTENKYYRSHKNSSLSKAKDYWSPEIKKTPTKPAIYNPKRNKTAERSSQNLKAKLIGAVSRNNEIPKATLEGVIVNILVLSNGTVNSVDVKHCKDEKLKSLIIKTIMDDNSEWQPALQDPKGLHPSQSPYNYNGQGLVKINSYFTIKF